MPRPTPFLPLFLALAVHASANAAQPADAEPAPAVRTADRLLAALVEANGVPGMGAAVTIDGVVVWTGSAGMRDVEAGLPVDRQTVFRLASVSKLVTATAAAKLAEAGKLDLDAPVQTMLPWLESAWAPITPRQLAAHTSGLPHYQAADASRGGKRYATVREAVHVFDDRPLLTAPNTEYRYSSWGYTLLSAAVEAGAGEPFLDYLDHQVTTGLDIRPDDSDRGGANLSRNYGFMDGRATRIPPHDFSYTWGGGGLASTPEAIALFGSRVMDGGIVSRETFEGMLEPATLADGARVRERDFEVGFGWRTSPGANGETIAHHAGVTDGARSALVLWPSRGAAASVLSNALWVSSIERTAEMLAAPFLSRPGVGERPVVACPVEAVAYAAEHAGERFQGAATFSEQDGHCSGRITLPDGALRAWLNGFPQRDADALEIIGLHPGAGIRQAALVTPIGLHDLRADGDGRTLRVQFNAERGLVVRLLASDSPP